MQQEYGLRLCRLDSDLAFKIHIVIIGPNTGLEALAGYSMSCLTCELLIAVH